MEEVECGECGNRYDSERDAFCPRCGNVGGKQVDQAAYAPARFDPRRRRAQIGGIILAVLGGFTFVMMAWAAIFPAELDDAQLDALVAVDVFRDQPGGDIHIRWMAEGEPLAGNATFLTSEGAVNVSLIDGWSNHTSATAFGNATLGNLTIGYYAPAGATVTGTVDTAEPPAWVAAGQIPATRIIAGFLAFFAAFVALAGILAIRLKAWGLAIAGAVIAMVPSLLMAVVLPLAGLLLAVPAALALAFIAMAKSHFS